MFRFFAISFTLLALAACSAKQSKPTPKFDSQLVQARSLSQWRSAIEQFNQHDSIDRYINYLDIVRSFDHVPHNELCLSKNIDSLIQALTLNETSLTATVSLYRCAVKQNKEALAATLLDNATKISTNLIGDNNGQSVPYAIAVREVDEAYLILDIAGFDVLASEIISAEKSFYYKIHTYDRLTKQFRYQYFSNAEFLYVIQKSALGQNLSADESIGLALTTYRERDYSPIVVHDIRTKMAREKLAEAKLLIPASANRAPIHNVLLAEIALQQESPQTLVELIDDLVNFQERGSQEAYLAVIHILLKYGETVQEFDQLEQQIKELVKLNPAYTNLSQITALLLSQDNANEQLQRWWQATQNHQLLSAVATNFMDNLGIVPITRPENFDLLLFAAQQNDPSAMFTVARYYLETPASPEQINLGQEYLTQSAALNYQPAEQYLTSLRNKI